MSWLIGQVWPLLVLAAALGAVCTAVLMTTRVKVERWVSAAPVERAFPVLGEVSAPEAAKPQPAAPAVRPSSPFPPLAGHAPDERPWEAEELWSRPARLAVGSGQRRSSKDEWTEAAANWRTWADEAAGRTFVDAEAAVDDDDLFAADREAERLAVGEDDFPFARPVEAAG